LHVSTVTKRLFLVTQLTTSASSKVDKLSKDFWYVLSQKEATYERVEFLGYGNIGASQSPSWKTTSCRLAATVYSIYLQLLSMSGGSFSSHYLQMIRAIDGGETSFICYLLILHKLVTIYKAVL
jgi:hypothetical protein